MRGKDLREAGRLLIDVPHGGSEEGIKSETSAANEARAHALADHILAISEGHRHTLAIFYQMARVHSLLFAHLDAEIAARRKERE